MLMLLYLCFNEKLVRIEGNSIYKNLLLKNGNAFLQFFWLIFHLHAETPEYIFLKVEFPKIPF